MHPRARIARRLVLLAVLASASLAARAADTPELTSARAVSGAPAQSAMRPQEVDFATGASVTLPDNWLRTRPDEETVVWYSVPLDAALQAVRAGARDDLVVVVPRAADRGEFWLNGERLDVGAGFTRNRALWLPLPGRALKPDGNALEARVSGVADLRAGLSALRFGRAADLQPGYELRDFLQTTVPQILVFVVAATLFAAVPLWLKTRRRAHLLFVLLCVLWLPRTIVAMSPTAGPPSAGGMLLALVSSLAASAAVALLVLEYLHVHGRFWPRYRRALLACVVASCVTGAAWTLFQPLTPRAFGLLYLPIYALLLAPLFAQVRAALLDRRIANAFLAVALAAWAVTAPHDLAHLADLGDFEGFFWSPSALLLVFLALVWRTIEGLALARDSADEEVRHAVTRERRTVIAEERERLLHDLHDGMGGQLITALRMARRDEVPREDVARVIEDSLEDMRLIIDSLDLDERDLLPLLGNLRYRMEPRLNAIGVALAWDVEPLPDLDYLTPETGLAIVRIVQEAVNNAVRHGAAKIITVRARAGAAGVELAVADDGCGFDVKRSSASASHHGLNAMRSRAKKLGGEIGIESGAGGTRVVLTLPLRR